MSVKMRIKEIVLDFLIKHVRNVQDRLLYWYAEIQLHKNRIYANNFLTRWRAAGRPLPEWLKAAYKKEREECKHLKGGPFRGCGFKDFNLACHRFADGSTKIWCLNGCGFSSRPGDSNWKEAYDMFERSSNSVTASEITPREIRQSGTIAVYQDSIPEHQDNG